MPSDSPPGNDLPFGDAGDVQKRLSAVGRDYKTHGNEISQALSRAATEARGLANGCGAGVAIWSSRPAGRRSRRCPYGYLLRHNPDQPRWINRDYFILGRSRQHVLVRWLHLSGYNLSL